MNQLRLGKHHNRIHAMTALLLAVCITASLGTGLSKLSLAGTNHDPIGVVNSCGFDGTNTVLFGWAHDPDAPAGDFPRVQIAAGGSVQVVSTNVVGYHDNKVNAFLAARSIATSSVYGFSVAYNGLMQGSSYVVNANALNAGSQGAPSAAMFVNTNSANYDGVPGQAFTSNGTATSATIPDICLKPRPAAAAPTPAPAQSAPQPAAQPSASPPKATQSAPAASSSTPSSSSSSSSPSKVSVSNNTSAAKKSSVSVVSQPSAPATEPTITQPGTTDGSVQTGTLGAAIAMTIEGAKDVSITYGTESNRLDNTVKATTQSDGTTATAKLTKLQAKTQYYYAIVRTDSSGKKSTSSTASFTTAGYGVALHFYDQAKEPVSDIIGVIDDTDDTKGKSNETGDLKFLELDAGKYTVTYQYRKLSYTQNFDTAKGAVDDTNPGKAVVLSANIDVTKLKNGSSDGLPNKGSGIFLKLLIGVIFVGLVVGVVLFILKRRRANVANDPYAQAYPTVSIAPNPQTSSPQTTPTTPLQSTTPTQMQPSPYAQPVQIVEPEKPAKRGKKTAPVESTEGLEHVGESLRDMVIRSMREEAKKRKQD